MKKDLQLDVYFVTDRGLLKGRPIEDIVDAAVKGGATIVQLREKERSTREFIQVAERVKDTLTPYNVPLFINDRLDIALALDADGVHDIAGMGGTPTAAFLSIGLPKDIKIEWLDQFFAGIRDLSEQTSTPLVVGDTTKSKERIIINIAVLGEATPQKIKYRSTAIEGDIIFVTAELGDSGCGLYLIFNDLDDETNKGHQQLVKAHHQPRPHLEEGKWIAGQK